MLTPFVTAEWLAKHYDEVVVCDVRMRPDSGVAYAEYSARHLPDARFIDLNVDLAAPAEPVLGRHPLPTPEHFAAVLGRVGIGESQAVVAYDDSAGEFAARLVWMLRALGGSAAVLEGGSDGWPGAFSSGPVAVEAVARPARLWPADRIVDGDGVAAALADGRVVIDSRAAERFRGEVEPLDLVAGHIPGAVNLPYSDHFEGGTLGSAEATLGRFAAAGVEQADAGQDPPIVYCGAGVTACVNILVAEQAGLGPMTLYVGSWSGWSTTPGAACA